MAMPTLRFSEFKPTDEKLVRKEKENLHPSLAKVERLPLLKTSAISIPDAITLPSLDQLASLTPLVEPVSQSNKLK